MWWDGPYRGETKLSNLVLACWHHHHLLHKDPGWRLVLDPASRRLDVYYRDRLVGSTVPPGRRRTGPVPAPAPHPTELITTSSAQPSAGPHDIGACSQSDVDLQLFGALA